MLPSMSAASYCLAKLQAVDSLGSNHLVLANHWTIDQPTNGLILLSQSFLNISQTSLLAQACWCQNGSEASRCLRRQSPQESQESPRNLPLMFCRWKQGYMSQVSLHTCSITPLFHRHCKMKMQSTAAFVAHIPVSSSSLSQTKTFALLYHP